MKLSVIFTIVAGVLLLASLPVVFFITNGAEGETKVTEKNVSILPAI